MYRTESNMEHPSIKAIRKIKILHEGFNMSFIEHPDHKNQYLATIRDKFNSTEYEYPTIENLVYLVRLDSSFQVLESKQLKEPPRKRYESFTTGLEDCRLVNDNMMTGVLLDNSEHWVPEMCLCHFDRNTHNISKIIVFNTNTEEPRPEKNWLVLKRNSNKFFMLYSYDPLKVMSVDIDTGECHLVHFQKIFNLENCEVHGGAVIHLERERKYLATVRIVNDNNYMFSMWLLLNEQYKLCGMSTGFLFSEPVEGKARYEMCMSLVEKNGFLYASVSVDDKEIYVYEFSLESILDSAINAYE